MNSYLRHQTYRDILGHGPFIICAATLIVLRGSSDIRSDHERSKSETRIDLNLISSDFDKGTRVSLEETSSSGAIISML